ncbi:putative NHN endonuclease [uncultured Caudovirales phage]|uniref:Putative NHN endonuclease n=1 Tax=uncultured Caudovirales phage TaxID=2100421 RepID=A0A6J7WID3_9CAUD|nr:putative NHN endonuclease [uncultured Caudovirales phage]
MTTIELTQGKECLIDSSFYEEVSKRKWCYSNVGYAVSRNKETGKVEYLHRIILKAEGKMQVDHINGNRLDNRLDNLRVVSAQNNIRNSKKRKGNYTSEFKGVCFDKSRNKYKAEITVDGKCKSIGRFINEKDAALAYNNEALKIFGEFAKINII